MNTVRMDVEKEVRFGRFVAILGAENRQHSPARAT